MGYSELEPQILNQNVAGFCPDCYSTIFSIYCQMFMCKVKRSPSFVGRFVGKDVKDSWLVSIQTLNGDCEKINY